MTRGKGRPFAVFDIDGTLIRWQLYHATADALARSGLIDAKIYEEIKNARMIWKRREEPEAYKKYEHKLIIGYEKMLKSLEVAEVDKAIDAVFQSYKDQVYTYTRELLLSLKQKGYLLLAISGSQMEIVKKIEKYYGFDDSVGTVYLQKNGRFTGESIIHATNKKAALEGLIAKYNLNLKGSIGVGDTPNDIAMLEIVEKPIVFNPDRNLFAHAKAKGWKIVVERKNMVYEMEKKDGRYVLAQAG